jgi:hypothetical protein
MAGARSNKGMKLPKLRAAPVRRAEVPRPVRSAASRRLAPLGSLSPVLDRRKGKRADAMAKECKDDG